MPAVGSYDEYSHSHSKLSQKITDLLLLIDRPAHHTIIFYRIKPLVMRPFYLVKKIFTPVILKHTIMKSIRKIKRFRFCYRNSIFLFCKRTGCCGAGKRDGGSAC